MNNIDKIRAANARIAELEAQLAEATERAEIAEDRLHRADFQIDEFRRDWQSRINYLHDLEEERFSRRAALKRVRLLAEESSLILADDHHEPEGCRFILGVDEDDSGITCFACLAQDKLGEIRVEALRPSDAGEEKEGECITTH